MREGEGWREGREGGKRGREGEKEGGGKVNVSCFQQECDFTYSLQVLTTQKAWLSLLASYKLSLIKL